MYWSVEAVLRYYRGCYTIFELKIVNNSPTSLLNLFFLISVILKFDSQICGTMLV